MADTTQACEDQHQRALILFRQGSYKEAAELLDGILESLETSEIWNDWATAQLMCNRTAESEQGYRRALLMDPANMLAAGNLGVLLSNTGRVPEALPLLERAAAASSGSEREALLRLLQVHGRQANGPCQVTSTPAAGVTGMEENDRALVPEPRKRCTERAGVYFKGYVYGGGDCAEEARIEMLGLSGHQIPVHLEPLEPSHDGGLPIASETRRRLEALERQPVDLDQSIFLQYATSGAWDMDTLGRWCVVRTMFETDGLPDGVQERCNRMDEVWLPSRFNIETYARAGVEEKKLRLLPAGVDTQLFQPGVAPLQIPRMRTFNFLSILDWQLNKGYDALLLAYLREFKPDEDVSLVLKLGQSDIPLSDLEDRLRYFVERRAGLRLEKAPPIIVIHGPVPRQDMPRLYAAADCFVQPARAEGYGRPLMAALSCKVPVIATGWGSPSDFLTSENSYLVDHRVVPVPDDVDIDLFAGHCWAEPQVDHLRQLMRQIFANKAEAVQRADRGRKDMVQAYDWSVIFPKWVAEFRRLLD